MVGLSLVWREWEKGAGRIESNIIRGRNRGSDKGSWDRVVGDWEEYLIDTNLSY